VFAATQRFNKLSQGTGHDLARITIRDFMPQEILGFAQQLVGFAIRGELNSVPLGCQGGDVGAMGGRWFGI